MPEPTDKQLRYAKSLVTRLEEHQNFEAPAYARQVARAKDVAEMSEVIRSMKALVDDLDLGPGGGDSY